MKNKEGIYKFYWDCGRMGFLDGVFTATINDVAKSIGKTAYFGEVLGKHSDIFGIIKPNDINLVSDSLEDIMWFKRLNLETGYNPISTLKDNQVL